MSYVNQNLLKMQKRRHSVRRVTPEEAIEAANEVVDKANDAIANAVAFRTHWQNVAAELDQENRRLRIVNEELRQENGQLKKRLKPKAGKKRDEWELES